MVNTMLSLLPQGAERVLMALGGAIGAAFSFAFGNIAPLMLWLAIFVACDFLTAWLAAIKNHSWSGQRLFWGVLRKMTMFSIIALAHGLDAALHDLIGFYFVQSVVLTAYTAGEFGSIIKNLERAGLGSVVPPILRYVLYAINQYLEEKAAQTLPIKLTKKE